MVHLYKLAWHACLFECDRFTVGSWLILMCTCDIFASRAPSHLYFGLTGHLQTRMSNIQAGFRYDLRYVLGNLSVGGAIGCSISLLRCDVFSGTSDDFRLSYLCVGGWLDALGRYFVVC